MRGCGPLPRAGQLVEFPFRLVPLPAEPLLELPDDLVPLAGGLVQIVVGQLAPLLLDLALELLPVALDLIPIHGVPPDEMSLESHQGFTYAKSMPRSRSAASRRRGAIIPCLPFSSMRITTSPLNWEDDEW